MTKLDQLADLLRKAPDEVFIQPHNVPDPDAIASCFGLQHLLKTRGVESVIVYDNEVEKANSLKMLELFGITMVRAGKVATMGKEDWTVLVDVQKHHSNLTDLVTEEVACIDHHERNELDGECRFVDIRSEAGACSSIIADYFRENGIDLPRTVATALIYGIFMDTSDLSRGVSELDINMFYWLYRLSDISLITELKGNQISQSDLHDYARAFEAVEIYDQVGFLYLDNCNDSLLGAAGGTVPWPEAFCPGKNCPVTGASTPLSGTGPSPFWRRPGYEKSPAAETPRAYGLHIPESLGIQIFSRHYVRPR